MSLGRSSVTSFVEDSAWHHHVKLAVRDRELADAFNCSVAKILRRRVNVITVTHDVGKVYYESKYSSRPLGLFLKGPWNNSVASWSTIPEHS